MKKFLSASLVAAVLAQFSSYAQATNTEINQEFTIKNVYYFANSDASSYYLRVWVAETPVTACTTSNTDKVFQDVSAASSTVQTDHQARLLSTLLYAKSQGHKVKFIIDAAVCGTPGGADLKGVLVLD